MLLPLAIADTRSMILVVLIVLSRVESAVEVCEETHFVSQGVSPTSFNIFFLKITGVFPLVIAVVGKSSALKLNLAKNCYPVSHGVFREWSLKLFNR